MNQSELTARVAEAEAQLGQPLPADYRAFLLDDTNEDKFTGDYLLFDSMICEFFLDPGAYTREDPDWTKDFPFTPENPLIADVPESFYTRLDNATTAAEYDAITEEQIAYLQKNFDEPALRGMAFLSDDGCNIYTAIILRGPARGQIWRHKITMDNADVQPYWHLFTKELLTFNDWRYFEQHRYLLTIDGRDDAQTYSIMNDWYGFLGDEAHDRRRHVDWSRGGRRRQASAAHGHSAECHVPRPAPKRMVSGAGCHGVSGELCGLIPPGSEHHRRIAAEIVACLSTPFVGEPVPVSRPVVDAEFPHPGENRAVVERVVGEIIGHVAHDHAGGPGAHAGNHEEVVEKLLVGDGLQVNVGVQAPCGGGLQGGFEEEQAQAVKLGVGRVQHALGGGHEVVGTAIVGDFFAHVLPEFFNGVLCLSRLHRVAQDRHRQGIPQGGGGYSDQPVVFLVGDSFAEVYAQVTLRAFD